MAPKTKTVKEKDGMSTVIVMKLDSGLESKIPGYAKDLRQVLRLGMAKIY